MQFVKSGIDTHDARNTNSNIKSAAWVGWKCSRVSQIKAHMFRKIVGKVEYSDRLAWYRPFRSSTVVVVEETNFIPTWNRFGFIQPVA